MVVPWLGWGTRRGDITYEEVRQLWVVLHLRGMVCIITGDIRMTGIWIGVVHQRIEEKSECLFVKGQQNDPEETGRNDHAGEGRIKFLVWERKKETSQCTCESKWEAVHAGCWIKLGQFTHCTEGNVDIEVTDGETGGFANGRKKNKNKDVFWWHPFSQGAK